MNNHEDGGVSTTMNGDVGKEEKPSHEVKKNSKEEGKKNPKDKRKSSPSKEKQPAVNGEIDKTSPKPEKKKKSSLMKGFTGATLEEFVEFFEGKRVIKRVRKNY